jgi:hypothetical protein
MSGAAIIGKVFQIVGGIGAAQGQFRSEMARAAQMKFESQMDLRNAELVKQDIAIAKEAGVRDRTNLSLQEAQVRGAGRVSFASGNVAVDEGSALDFDIAAAEQAALERERSKDAEELTIHRLRTEKQGLLASAELKRRAAKTQKKSAKLGQAGGILSSIGGGIGSMGGK